MKHYWTWHMLELFWREVPHADRAILTITHGVWYVFQLEVAQDGMLTFRQNGVVVWKEPVERFDGLSVGKLRDRCEEVMKQRICT